MPPTFLLIFHTHFIWKNREKWAILDMFQHFNWVQRDIASNFVDNLLPHFSLLPIHKLIVTDTGTCLSPWFSFDLNSCPLKFKNNLSSASWSIHWAGGKEGMKMDTKDCWLPWRYKHWQPLYTLSSCHRTSHIVHVQN